MEKVLIATQDQTNLRAICAILKIRYDTKGFESGRALIEVLQKEKPDTLIVDMELPDTGGIAILNEAFTLPTRPAILLLYASLSTSELSSIINKGVCEFIKKPFTLDEIARAIERARNQMRSRAELGSRSPALIGESQAMKKARAAIARLARFDYPVLVTGESGTGKELAAAAIHTLSCRRRYPFVARNCGSYTESIVESELFGTERGAFTDSVNREGDFERAGDGTIFLDEIGELSLNTQAKLLRVLETGEVMRLGGRNDIPIKCRLVSATNIDLDRAVEERRFRLDLMHRIDTLFVEMPPLRSRKEDIPALVERFAQDEGFPGLSFSNGAIEKLVSHDWPGNVRELRNVVKRAIVASEEAPVVSADHIVIKRSRSRQLRLIE